MDSTRKNSLRILIQHNVENHGLSKMYIYLYIMLWIFQPWLFSWSLSSWSIILCLCKERVFFLGKYLRSTCLTPLPCWLQIHTIHTNGFYNAPFRIKRSQRNEAKKRKYNTCDEQKYGTRAKVTMQQKGMFWAPFWKYWETYVSVCDKADYSKVLEHCEKMIL